MKIVKQQVYPCLENLQNRRIVNATLGHPALFSAVPLEKVLDMLKNQKIKEAQETQEHKTAILSAWKSMKTEDSTKT